MGKAIRSETAKHVITWDREEALGCGETACCALVEISGIQYINDPFTTLVNLAYYDDGLCIAPIVLFTSTNEHLAGDELMDLIHKEKLGTVTFSKGVKNWADTGSTVYLYTWIVDKKAWEKYAQRINDELSDNY